jgi:hypothetical protein
MLRKIRRCGKETLADNVMKTSAAQVAYVGKRLRRNFDALALMSAFLSVTSDAAVKRPRPVEDSPWLQPAPILTNIPRPVKIHANITTGLWSAPLAGRLQAGPDEERAATLRGCAPEEPRDPLERAGAPRREKCIARPGPRVQKFLRPGAPLQLRRMGMTT